VLLQEVASLQLSDRASKSRKSLVFSSRQSTKQATQDAMICPLQSTISVSCKVLIRINIYIPMPLPLLCRHRLSPFRFLSDTVQVFSLLWGPFRALLFSYFNIILMTDSILSVMHLAMNFEICQNDAGQESRIQDRCARYSEDVPTLLRARRDLHRHFCIDVKP
jgi:hypothetical protein